jgi:hypothetical protein
MSNIYNSDLPFVQPSNDIKRAPASRPRHRNRDVEFALQSDLDPMNTDLSTLQLRAVYRPEYDYLCLPKGQDWAVFCTFGPNSATKTYDVDTSNSGGQEGILFMGAYPTEEAAFKVVSQFRRINPGSKLLTVHPVYLDGIVQFPIPSDGAASDHPINNVKAEIYQNHFDGIVGESQSILNAKEATNIIARQSNETVAKFNAALKQALTASVETMEQEYKRVLANFQVYERDPETISTLPGYREGTSTRVLGESERELTPEELKQERREYWEKCLNDAKSITPNLVDNYLEVRKSASSRLGAGQRVDHVLVKRADGKQVLVEVKLQQIA